MSDFRYTYISELTNIKHSGRGRITHQFRKKKRVVCSSNMEYCCTKETLSFHTKIFCTIIFSFQMIKFELILYSMYKVKPKISKVSIIWDKCINTGNDLWWMFCWYDFEQWFFLYLKITPSWETFIAEKIQVNTCTCISFTYIQGYVLIH